MVIGAGAVGLEWGDIFHELGAKITVIEMLDRVLPPADAEVSQELARSFQKKGFDLLLGVGVKGIEKKNGALSVRYAKGDGPEKTVEAEAVLVATGRWPYTNGLGLEKAGVQPGQALAAGTVWNSAKETDPEPKNLRPAQRTIAGETTRCRPTCPASTPSAT